mmetsp:Transcript_72283/g.192020  ORF Transcript_72283/g.192020 Transcript_72283/m.192020 type:complete len:246 (-) Transcript_72283:262-999(-)
MAQGLQAAGGLARHPVRAGGALLPGGPQDSALRPVLLCRTLLRGDRLLGGRQARGGPGDAGGHGRPDRPQEPLAHRRRHWGRLCGHRADRQPGAALADPRGRLEVRGPAAGGVEGGPCRARCHDQEGAEPCGAGLARARPRDVPLVQHSARQLQFGRAGGEEPRGAVPGRRDMAGGAARGGGHRGEDGPRLPGEDVPGRRRGGGARGRMLRCRRRADEEGSGHAFLHAARAERRYAGPSPLPRAG